MDVGKIFGPNNAGRDSGRASGVDRGKGAKETRALSSDVAHISSSGRETHETVETLVARLGASDELREAKVAAARERMLSGAYEDPAVLREAAKRMV